MIERKRYLDKLISSKENGLIKIITGIRRCGKSYLLFRIFYDYLIASGVDEKHIITLALDDVENIKYRNPFELDSFIKGRITDDKTHYVLLDEIQNVATVKNPYIESGEDTVGFVDVLNGLLHKRNIDVYVTGSNSKMLSSDIATQFRGRGEEIRVNPLSFQEFYAAHENKQNARREYCVYGGMPYILSLSTHEAKSRYLTDLFARTYLTDVLERNKVSDAEALEELLNVISSSIGSLTNPTKLANTFKSVKNRAISSRTIEAYLTYLYDAFLISKAYRYDIKGKKYIGTPLKYYFTDIGLRNARLNFRQTEENHIMENIIYNELLLRGFNVDVGVVEYNYKDADGRSKKTFLEVDFVANNADKRYYIQSALHIDTEEKRLQETNSLNRIDDSFKKIVVVKDNIIPRHDEKGVLYIGIEQFLLDENAMDL